MKAPPSIGKTSDEWKGWGSVPDSERNRRMITHPPFISGFEGVFIVSEQFPSLLLLILLNILYYDTARVLQNVKTPMEVLPRSFASLLSELTINVRVFCRVKIIYILEAGGRVFI